MHRSKNSFLEWLVYSLIFFFLYDIIRRMKNEETKFGGRRESQ